MAMQVTRAGRRNVTLREDSGQGQHCQREEAAVSGWRPMEVRENEKEQPGVEREGQPTGIASHWSQCPAFIHLP